MESRMPVKYLRKIIHIPAEDSPNVKLALMELKLGRKPSGKQIMPGVLSYDDYKHRMETWDDVRKTIGVKGMFYEGAETLLYPPDWLNRAEYIGRLYLGRDRQAISIGVDSAEGGDKTALAAVDRLGLIELVSMKTPDTSKIVTIVRDFMAKHHVSPEYTLLDRGGGGKQHADRLRAMGLNVGTIAFGESVTPEPGQVRPGYQSKDDKVERKEVKYTYFNRRAQLYGEFRELLDPVNTLGFALPEQYIELRRQLAPIPLIRDSEGRLKMPPKRRKSANSIERSLEEILGCSPDEADAVVLAVHRMLHPPLQIVVGGIR